MLKSQCLLSLRRVSRAPQLMSLTFRFPFAKLEFRTPASQTVLRTK